MIVIYNLQFTIDDLQFISGEWRWTLRLFLHHGCDEEAQDETDDEVLNEHR